MKRRLVLESELVPYAPGFPPGNRWLFLFPHADDEVFGAGATLALAARRGIAVQLVVVTDGAAQGEAAQRRDEARAASAALGLSEPRFLAFADRSLAPGDRRLIGAITDLTAELEPEAVFVTSPVELHPDHRALALAAQRAMRRRTLGGLRRVAPRWLVAYEVATAMAPNILVDADPAWDVKQRAGACYASQNAYRPYGRTMDALATLRSLTLDGVERAEAFFSLPAANVARLSARRWASLCGSPLGVRTRRG